MVEGNKVLTCYNMGEHIKNVLQEKKQLQGTCMIQYIKYPEQANPQRQKDWYCGIGENGVTGDTDFFYESV